MSATIIFMYGPDTYRSRAKLRQVKKRYVDASLGDTNLSVLPGDTLQFSELVRQVQAFPFLAKKRLVVVENLLLAGKKDMEEPVSAYLPKVPDSTVLLFYEAGEPDKRTKLFKALAKVPMVEHFPYLEGENLRRWMAKEFQEYGVVPSQPLIQKLVYEAGGDLWRLSNDIAKIALYQRTTGSEVRDEDLAYLLVGNQASDVFRLTQAIAAGSGAEALRELNRLRVAGQADLYLLSMIVYQYRTLLILAEAYEEGIRAPFALAETLKLAPFVVQKNLPIARRLGLARLIEIYHRLLDYDWKMKTGDLEPALAIEMLVGELVHLGGSLAPERESR